MGFLKDLLTAEWLWITISACIGIALLPFPALYVYLKLPPFGRLAAVVGVAAAGGVAAGLRDYHSS